MRDWLNAELANVGGVTKQEVDNHVAGSQPLEVSSAVANSDKHHTRTHGITARIRRGRAAGRDPRPDRAPGRSPPDQLDQPATSGQASGGGVAVLSLDRQSTDRATVGGTAGRSPHTPLAASSAGDSSMRRGDRHQSVTGVRYPRR
jgi:hypothetical protein